MDILTKLLTVDDVAELLRVNKQTVYQSLPGAHRPKLGRHLPEPIRLGRSLRWRPEDIYKFIEELAAAAGLPPLAALQPQAQSASVIAAPSPAPRLRGRPRSTARATMELAGGAA